MLVSQYAQNGWQSGIITTATAWLASWYIMHRPLVRQLTQQVYLL
jgi:hypothetical protein